MAASLQVAPLLVPITACYQSIKDTQVIYPLDPCCMFHFGPFKIHAGWRCSARSPPSARLAALRDQRRKQRPKISGDFIYWWGCNRILWFYFRGTEFLLRPDTSQPRSQLQASASARPMATCDWFLMSAARFNTRSLPPPTRRLPRSARRADRPRPSSLWVGGKVRS